MLDSKYSFLENILKNIIDLSEADYENFSNDRAEEAIKYLPDDWKYNYGVSKLVLIPDKYDFVVKIPCSCSGYDDFDEDGYETYVTYPFEGANYIEEGTCGWDYCRAEAEFYEEAVEYGVEKFFAKTICIGTIDDWPIYIQEKCLICDEHRTIHSEAERVESRRKISEMDVEPDERIPIDFLVDMFRNHDEQEVTEVFNFIDNVGICDLHSSNCGYNRAGFAVFTDYSGYDD